MDTRHLEQLLPFVGGVVQGALPGGPFVSTVLLGDLTGRTPVAVGTAAEAGLWLGAAHRSVGIRPGQVIVGRSLVLPPPAAHAPPRGVADLVEGIGRTYPPQPGGPGSAPAGTVEVKQLERPDGTRTWVVTIPGTQEWDPRQVRNPFDVVSNLHLMARRADDVTAAVERAMQLAGIPPGEPVVLAGHSQGGIAAAALAADPDLRGRFDIRAVVTAGSPVAHLAVPPDVATVHLEHRQDPVHALDARPNPDAPHRTTAQVDLRAAPDAALRAAAASPVAAHDVEVYARTAAALEEAGDPGWTAATAELEDLLAGAATVSTAWFTATRVPTANRP
ncbi:MAG: hypothetical protein H5T83_12360 [Actinotalea sp.]|nr:hypothetical protein [Actinotalea sp.]